eukprot:TRINITY_DN6087_c0_g2_i1.p1 TRINITY_DN6087_c0_g2~~TRINITY_DN6087_c0_g2_i1.p1  ORF type:complete len:1135 (+),score=233.96 TRINITY_DN6087_c0_g2_i1:474-3407(+)
MERVWGGELFQPIVKKQGLSECEARYVFRQLLEGVSYMHTRGVIHRDLKPENILIVRTSNAPGETGAAMDIYDVKIADFGLSKVIHDGASTAKTFVGTPQYWAPEVLKVRANGGSYGPESDLWGLGAVLFVMLTGRYPFDGKKQPLEEQIATASLNLGSSRWRRISPEAKDLVQGLLRVNPQERLRLESCFCHAWVMGTTLEPSLGLPEEDLSGAVRPEPPAADGGAAPASSTREAPEESGSAAVAPPRSPEGRSRCAHLPAVEEERGSPSRSGPDAGSRKHSGDNAVTATSKTYSATSVHSSSPSVEVVDSEERPYPSRGGRCGRCCRRRPAAPTYYSLVPLVLAVYFFLRAHFLTSKNSGYSEELRLSDGQQVVQRPSGPSGPMSVAVQSLSCVRGGDIACPVNIDVQASTAAATAAAVAAAAPTSSLQVRVPEIPLRAREHQQTEADCEEQETVFRLGELLKLQVSIMGSLKTASLAFRHADRELAEATHQTFLQARQIFQDANNVISRFAEVAQQVSESILPDLRLAVEEKAPDMAMGLLSYVKVWVTKMRSDGEATRTQYGKLQDSVLHLAQRAQQTKTNADRRLHEAAQAVEAQAVAAKLQPQNRYALESRTSSSAKSGSAGSSASELHVCTGGSFAGAPGVAAAEMGLAGADAMETDMLSLNGRTRKLFEHLGDLAPPGGGAGGASSAGDGAHGAGAGNSAGASAGDGSSAPASQVATRGDTRATSSSSEGEEERWKREVLDLLFMAPGVVGPEVSSSAARLAARSQDADSDDDVVAPGEDEEEMEDELEGVGVDEDLEDDASRKDDGAAGTSSGGSLTSGSGSSEVVPYVKDGPSKIRPDYAVRSSASLLRALRELRRVDTILQGCSSFWANMDGTVQRLAHMKEHTEALVNFAADNARLMERFHQRLREYTGFWAALERICRQYCADHQATSERMFRWIRDIEDAVDLVHTTESIKTGAAAARKDRER